MTTISTIEGCDVVAIRVEDIAASGYTADRATVRQKKTGRPVRFELSEQTRQAVDDYLKAAQQEAPRVLVHWSGYRTQHDNAPVCTPRFRVDWQRWTGPEAFWDALTTTHESYLDLPANRQP